MKTATLFVLFCLNLCSASAAQSLDIDTVPVGNAGARVDYNYRIGKYEVTNAQYVGFLNSVDPLRTNTLNLYNSTSKGNPVGGITFDDNLPDGSKYLTKPGFASKPVVWVSWYDAIRFTNWLHNGQGNGDTETGAYTLGALGPGAAPVRGESIVRNRGATWFLPNKDEWIKAARHKNDGVTENYWNYANSTDTFPYSDQPPGLDAPDPSNTANFFRYQPLDDGYNDGFAVTASSSYDRTLNYLTDVGAYTFSSSAYGTFDQIGNVAELIEIEINSNGTTRRGAKGGDWGGQHAGPTYIIHPSKEETWLGFRVASIPEPGTLFLGAVAAVGLMMRSGRTT